MRPWPRRPRASVSTNWTGAGVAAAVFTGLLAAGIRRFRRWRTRPEDTVFEWPTGLTEAEATRRWRAGQANVAHLKPVRTWEHVRRESIFTVFNLNLIGLALVLGLLSAWWSALVTIFMLGLTTTIRVAQEQFAARRLARFRAATTTRYSVIRDSKLRSVDPDRVVPGDVLVAGPGDQILVDGHLLGPGSLTLDVSALTGRREWQRVRPGGVVHGGTFCITGRSAYRAERVGADRLVHSRLAVRPLLAAHRTPLERLVARVLVALLVLVVVYAGLLLAAFFRLDIGATGEVFVDAAPVIFSLAPSGLYLMIIVSYATGTADLAQRGALVHSARSVESLATTTVLCFTEVGILAGTSMELTALTGADGEAVPESRLRQVLGDLARSTSAPSAVARLLADAFDGERRAVREEANHLATLGWTAIAFGEADAQGLYVLGEPKALAGHLAPREEGPDVLPADDLRADELLADDGDAAQETLILAHLPERAPLTDAAGRPRLPDGLVVLGTVRFRRHLRPEAMAVVRAFEAAGVRVKAFAAGRAADAVAVLRAAGLSPEDEERVLSRGMLSRSGLEALPRSEWGQAAADHSLFGGLTPLQVGELVRALRLRGEVVTVVGDGVGDLPALTEANLAVAQPASTQAALGLADIVLLDNSPGALLKVLEQGQGIVRGLLDVIRLNLTMVLCSALLIIAVRTLTTGFPYVAGQGSVIGVLTVTIPSLALSLWSRPGAVSRANYSRILLRFVLPAGVSLSVAALIVYEVVLQTSGRVAYAQLAVTHTLIFAGLLVSVVLRRDRRTARLAAVLASLFLLLPLVPYARRQFRLDWLQPGGYLLVAAVVLGWLLVVLVGGWLAERLWPLDPVRPAGSGRIPVSGSFAEDDRRRHASPRARQHQLDTVTDLSPGQQSLERE